MIRLTEFPDDILEEIFHAMRNLICFPGEKEHVYEPPLHSDQDSDQDEHEFEFEYNEHKSQAKGVPLWANIIALSHVCSYWRNLMLSRPRLWTFIRVTGTFANRVMVNEMLDRAGPFPLSVLFTQTVHQRYERYNPHSIFDLIGVASVISDHSERIVELGTVLQPDGMAAVLASLAKCRMPILDKLWLDDGTPLRSGKVKVQVGTPSIFDNSIPPLRILHVHDIFMPWLPFEDLVRLDLTYGPAPPLPALLHTLRTSPRLEILTLCIPTWPASSPSMAQLSLEDELHIDLPCLRKLTLEVDHDYDTAFAVLPHISFRPTTDVSLGFSGRRGPPCLYTHCTSLEAIAAAVERVEYVAEETDMTYITAIPTSMSTSDGVALQPKLSIAYHVMAGPREAGPGKSHSPGVQFCSGFRAVPFPALETLSMVNYTEPGHMPFEMERYKELFDCVPTITRLELHLHPGHVAPVFEALGRQCRPSGEEGTGEEGGEEYVLCPQLKHLVITWWKAPRVDDFWCIERCCLARSNAGSRIEHLETLAFPDIVLGNLVHSVGTIGVLGSSDE